jgi:transcriptional regulator with XRE-family HTH domain
VKTIEEVFSENLKRLRGDRTQAYIAELAGVPLRSYQKSEALQLPRPDNRRAIARAFGVSEAELFLDPALASRPAAVPAKVRLLELIAALDEAKAQFFLSKYDDLLARFELENRVGADRVPVDEGLSKPVGNVGDGER